MEKAIRQEKIAGFIMVLFAIITILLLAATVLAFYVASSLLFCILLASTILSLAVVVVSLVYKIGAQQQLVEMSISV
jgi:hypothetical protein